MSNIYHTEPPTQGKVVIKTSHGDIGKSIILTLLSYSAHSFLSGADIELWSKEAPLACRNFIQLALEGYYDSTIIHRVIKGFMIQLGEPRLPRCLPIHLTAFSLDRRCYRHWTGWVVHLQRSALQE